MLTTYPGNPRQTWWVDLVDPTDEEKAAAESLCRFRIPSRQELSEIETSSRISEDNGMVDLCADTLEGIGTELDTMSRSIFPKRGKGRKRLVAQTNDALRGLLIDVGNIGERPSRARDILLGLQRIVPFVALSQREWVPQQMQERLRTLSTDVVSLTDYEEHLAGKVQFLLDAVLGLINTKQNDLFTVLTVVSVIGIPPTLVASIYGMNVRNMPELTWAYGYHWGLALIALSTILPILWFKWRGWL